MGLPQMRDLHFFIAPITILIMKTTTIVPSAPISDKTRLYKQVFGEAPWNEGYVCRTCESLYPTSGGKPETCRNCGGEKIEEFYDTDELRAELEALTKREGYVERVAEILNGGLVGFAWGWISYLDTLNREKLALNNEAYAAMLAGIAERFPEYDGSSVYYFAEIGVRAECRGKDIAGELYRSKMEGAKSLGKNYSVVRTTRKSDVPFKWFVRDGFEIVYEYGDNRDRVILMKSL